MKRSLQAARERRTNIVWFISLTVFFAVIGYSGLVVVENADDMRALYQASGNVQRENDYQLAEFSRLTLEVGALTSLQTIEETARSELDMEFPETVAQVLR